MLDHLRDQSDKPLFEEEPAPFQEQIDQKKTKIRPRRTFDQLTGTTPFQRFLLAVMLFLVILLAGAGILFLFGKVDTTHFIRFIQSLF